MITRTNLVSYSVILRETLLCDYMRDCWLLEQLYCEFPHAIEFDSMEMITCLVESNVSPLTFFPLKVILASFLSCRTIGSNTTRSVCLELKSKSLYQKEHVCFLSQTDAVHRDGAEQFAKWGTWLGEFNFAVLLTWLSVDLDLHKRRGKFLSITF